MNSKWSLKIKQSMINKLNQQFFYVFLKYKKQKNSDELIKLLN